MADVSITAANVVADEGFGYSDGIAGVAVTAGQAVYKDANDANKFKLADANASLAAATAVGIALHGAAAGQPLRVMTSGTLTIGGTVAAGLIYVVSATAGGIAPSADLTTGWYTTVLGLGISTTKISVGLTSAGVAVA